jgi:DNA ligase 1
MTSTPVAPAAPTRRQCCLALAGWAAGPITAAAPLPVATVAPMATAIADAASSPPPLLLAREWPDDGDPSGFLVSEKYDGVRAFWDGRTLRFRSGLVVAAPRWFTERLPARPLDGELWLGRGRFEALSGLVRRSDGSPASHDDWQAISYRVFELPGAPGDFRQRAAALQALVTAQRWPALVAVEQSVVAGSPALQRRLDAVVAGGGEGLMLHRADARYVTGRAAVLYKHKPLHDAEALVLAHQPGQGRLAGRLGALTVRTDDGRTLRIGTGFSEAQRVSPPAPGQRITFTHRGWTAQGLPRFASFLRLSPGL